MLVVLVGSILHKRSMTLGRVVRQWLSWREGGGLGQSPELLLLSWQLAASIDISPLTKIHQAAVLAHRFRFSIGGGSRHQRIMGPRGNTLQCGAQTLCHGGVPRGSTGAQTAMQSRLPQA